MDFRAVEQKYRRWALCWQITLFLFLCAFLVFNVVEIVMYPDNPPVEQTVEDWQGGGVWAVCTGSNEPIYAVGYGIYEGPYDSRAEAGKKWPLVKQEIVGGNCCTINLTEWKWQHETVMRLCIQAPKSTSFRIWSNDYYKYVGHPHNKGQILVFSYRRSKHGWNYGYVSEVSEFHDMVEEDRWPETWGGGQGACPHWTTFSEETAPVDAIFVSIQSPVVHVSKKQGMLPRMFNLMTGIGGWISILTLMFNAVFVRMHTDSAVAKIYEARTFVGEKIGLSLAEQSKKKRKTDDAEDPKPLPLPPGMYTHLETE